VYDRRTKTFIKPMFENEFEAIASDIGSQTIVVRRANIRFAPTLVSDIGWISITTIYPKIYDRLLNYFQAVIVWIFFMNINTSLWKMLLLTETEIKPMSDGEGKP